GAMLTGKREIKAHNRCVKMTDGELEALLARPERRVGKILRAAAEQALRMRRRDREHDKPWHELQRLGALDDDALWAELTSTNSRSAGEEWERRAKAGKSAAARAAERARQKHAQNLIEAERPLFQRMSFEQLLAFDPREARSAEVSAVIAELRDRIKQGECKI